MKKDKMKLGYWMFLFPVLILLVVSPGNAEGLLLSNEGSSSSSSIIERYTFTVEADEAGKYCLLADYKVASKGIQKLVFALRVNGELQDPAHENLTLPAAWRDESQDYAVNEFGSDLYPLPVLVEEDQHQYLRERVYCSDEPLLFDLQAGNNEIEITVTEASAVFSALTAVKPEAIPDFETYVSEIQGQKVDTEPIVIEGEKYTTKTVSSIRAGRSRNAELHPFDASRATINCLAGSTWDDPGEGVNYTFTVNETGVYYLGVRYQQNSKSDMNTFKTIRMDGKTICQPLSAYGFAYTGSGIEETVLSVQGQPIPFYLESGEHTLSMISTAAPIAAAHSTLRQVVTEMNTLALDIRVISGNKVDTERSWKLDYYMPEAHERLQGILEKIDHVYSVLETSGVGTGKTTLSTLDAARRQVEGYLTDKDGLDNLVNQLPSFAQSSGSMAESLSLMAPDMLLQPLTIDRIYLLGDPKDLPNDNTGFLEKAWQEVRKTVLSFTVESDTAQTNRDDQLNVWLIGSVQEQEVLRELADQAFPGSSVHIALANEGKIQLAIAADNAPDVVLGGNITQPYQLGIRGAVYDLSTFEDFEEVKNQFYSESFVPVTLGESIYALPQTMDMWVFFYRSDILDMLGLEVPDTWDELIAMLPTLYRYGMNVNTAMAAGGALKNYTQLMPLIMECGGELYAPDGMSAAFCTPEFIDGFTRLTELYTKYGVATSIGNFYSSMRNGTAPVGISAIGTYTLLRRAASELDGMWGVAPIPALEKNGEYSRLHPAVVSGCYLLSSTKRAQEGWEFLKWWMSAETQNNFATRLQTTYGEEYLWITANREALAQTTVFADQDREVLLVQLESLKEIPSHPATMLVQRALSDAWNRVVFNGEDVRSALDTAQLEADRGIRKKLQQFGLIDESGTVVRTLWQEEEP